MTKKVFKVPSWLDNMAKTEWKRIRELLDPTTFGEMDLKALEAYCQAYAKWKRCETILIKEGYTFKAPSGYLQQRPEVSISNNALSDMQSIAKELGFTPASRIRMQKNAKDNPGGGPTHGNTHDKEMEEMIS